MRRDNYQRQYTTDPFIDLLFNALLGFTLLFLISVMFMNPEARKGRVDLKAEYIISVTWPEQLSEDIDLWVRDPYGETVSYLQKEVGWLVLDRDDRGVVNDTIKINGRDVIYPINQEVVTLRGIIPGEYIVNLFYYKQYRPRPVEALVKVEKVNPTLTTVFVRKMVLPAQDAELTALRFTLDQDGRFTGVNQLPATITPYALDPDQL